MFGRRKTKSQRTTYDKAEVTWNQVCHVTLSWRFWLVRYACFVCRRLEELKTTQQQYLESLKKYENEHMGGFRRIYPMDGHEKYNQFFENSCSLFQTTTAAKAREEAAK